MNRGAPIARQAGMRRCGKRYDSELDARVSKRGQLPGAGFAACPVPGCGGWHVLLTGTREDTGFPTAVRLAVRARAGNGDPLEARCEADGVWLGLHGGQVHHRCNRQMGGSKLRNTIENAALLCGTPYVLCHGAATRLEVRMRERGFVLNSGQDPALVPVRPYGDERRRWLTVEGGYTFTPPEGAEAA